MLHWPNYVIFRQWHLKLHFRACIKYNLLLNKLFTLFVFAGSLWWLLWPSTLWLSSGPVRAALSCGRIPGARAGRVARRAWGLRVAAAAPRAHAADAEPAPDALRHGIYEVVVWWYVQPQEPPARTTNVPRVRIRIAFKINLICFSVVKLWYNFKRL